jgi:tetratricopeptide (TPR) repeat protein
MLVAPITADAVPPGVSARSPLKTALVILTMGFLGAAGYWVWAEGVPTFGEKAAADTMADGPGIGSAVVEYAEALVNGSIESNLNPAVAVGSYSGDADRGPLTPLQRRSKVRDKYEAGKKLMAMGRHAEAAPLFTEAIKLDPNFVDAHYRLGLAYVQAGDIKSAKRALAELGKLDADRANLLRHLLDD